MTAPAFTTTQVLAMHNLAVGGTSVDLKFFNYLMAYPELYRKKILGEVKMIME
jgi:hypothetical protein